MNLLMRMPGFVDLEYKREIFGKIYRMDYPHNK